MQPTGNLVLWSGFGAIARVFSLARAMLALVGLAAVLSVALPAPRDWIIRQVVALAHLADEPAGSVSAAGEIRAEDSANHHERRAVSGFIAKRYKVADEAVSAYVATAYRAGSEQRVDPLLILAVMAVESRYNPVAESVMGAKGLMQVIPKYHHDKLAEHGGEAALLDPEVNIRVGTKILREYTRRFGGTETALQMYAGAGDEPGGQYSRAVLAERLRLEQMLARTRRGAST